MPAQGRGAFLPPQKNALPAAKLPQTRVKPTLSLPSTRRSYAPETQKGLRVNLNTAGGQRTAREGVRAAQSIHAQSGLGILDPGLPSAVGSTIAGVPGGAVPGKIAAELINLPTQSLPGAYHMAHAGVEAIKGQPGELHELGNQFLKESALAHVVKGDFGGALKAAGAHPIGTLLEAGGVASGVDRALGGIGRASGSEVAKLAEPGSTTVTRQPRQLVPGGASEALRPYDKGLVRKMVEQKLDKKPLSEAKVTAGLRKHYDRTESSLLRITRASRQDVLNKRQAAIGGHKTIAGKDAVVPHGQWLADPSVLDRNGVPLYQTHLKEMVAHLSQPRRGELPHEAAAREANRDYFQNLREDSKYHANPDKAYQASLKLAQDKRALEPQLEQHGVYTKEQMRAAKVIPAFQFHFRNQDPFVDTTFKEGESPFSIAAPRPAERLPAAGESRAPVPLERRGAAGEAAPRRQMSIDQVYKQLEAQGVHEHQLSFVSTRPFQNPNAAFRSGHTPGGAKVAKGHLTGAAFRRGQFDPTYDAGIRQHLTDQSIIDRANGDFLKANSYVHDKAAVAKLVEAKIHTQPPELQTALKNYVSELRQGGKFFEQHDGKSELAHALKAREVLKGLYPDSKLEPVRTVHPYATVRYTAALNKRLHDATLDQMDPSKFKDDQQFWQSQLFTPHEIALDSAGHGPVGLVHSEIAKRMGDYQKDLGKSTLLRMPASFWRRNNVAFSVRHIPGVTQEIGARALLNNVGLISHMRGSKVEEELLRYAEHHPDSKIKFAGQNLRAMGRGTVAAYTEDLARHTPVERLSGKSRVVADWWQKGTAQKVTGAPLRAIQGAVKVYGRVTTGILAGERKLIEHPPQIAGMGKHYNNEFKAITGKRLKVIGSFNDVEKAFLRGQLDPKALDHAGNMFREYWGDWSRASPEMKKAMSVSPFAQWYLNSLRFVYRTMPLHHPVKTGLLAAIQGATAEERAKEGQGYKGGLPLGEHLLPTDLEPSQQGSLPYGKERLGAEYYSPPGAVSGGLETALGSLLPYLSGTWSVLHGVNPLTNRPLEEKIEGKKQPVTDFNTLASLGAMSALESFVPPIRYAQSLQKKPASYVFRPLRTEKTRLERGTKKAKAIKLGSTLGTGLGAGSLGSSLK